MDRNVVKILRNGVEIISLNGYHSNVWQKPCERWESRDRTLVGEIPAFRLPVTISYDNTKSPGIKESDG